MGAKITKWVHAWVGVFIVPVVFGLGAVKIIGMYLTLCRFCVLASLVLPATDAS